MTDPERLGGETADAVEQRLLEVARDYRVSPHTRRRTLAIVGLSGSVGISAIAGKAAAAIAVNKVFWAVIATTGAVALGVAGARIASVPSSAEPARLRSVGAPAIGATPRVDPQPVSVASSVARSEIESPGKLAASTEQPRTRSHPARDLASGSVANAEGADSLSAEVAMLDEARAALRARRAASALEVLARYHEQFPKRRLGLEASVLRMEALAQSGQTAAAAAEARAFLKRHPKSALAARVERLANP